MCSQWQLLPGMQVHWRRDRDVRDGWTVTGEPRAAAQALVEDACELMELCAHHLDISRSAYLQTYRMRFPGEQTSDSGTVRAPTSTG